MANQPRHFARQLRSYQQTRFFKSNRLLDNSRLRIVEQAEAKFVGCQSKTMYDAQSVDPGQDGIVPESNKLQLGTDTFILPLDEQPGGGLAPPGIGMCEEIN